MYDYSFTYFLMKILIGNGMATLL